MPTATPAPTATPTPAPTATPTATPTPVPIEAPESAWGCFFDRASVVPPDNYPVTRCGWHGPIGPFSKFPRISLYAIDGGSDAWRAEMVAVLAETGALADIRFVEATQLQRERASVHLIIEFVDAALVDCVGVAREGCGQEIWGREPGRVWIAERRPVSAGLLRHELLHAMAFVHAQSGIMDVEHAPGEYSEQDLEMLRLYAAIPRWLPEADIRARACIGSGGVCDIPYTGGQI
ncbi:MAG: hypothetical protein OXE50_12695 [Chloroflexi bacterium]|nr:hypothetical protein [Chloroflexota bacterium]